MNTLAIIVARGNSKRILRKNLKKIGKYPLVYWVAKAAIKSKVDNVVISTEDKEIAKIGEKAGIKRIFWRSKKLTRDYTDDLDIILDALKKTEIKLNKKFDTIALIQPTTPFIRPNHINNCLKKLLKNNLSCVFSARIVKDHPRLVWHYKKKQLVPILKSKILSSEQHFQKLDKNYIPNGGVWCVKVSELKKQKSVYSYPIDIVEVPFKYSIDIDTHEDLLFARLMFKEHKIKLS